MVFRLGISTAALARAGRARKRASHVRTEARKQQFLQLYKEHTAAEVAVLMKCSRWTVANYESITSVRCKGDREHGSKLKNAEHLGCAQRNRMIKDWVAIIFTQEDDEGE